MTKTTIQSLLVALAVTAFTVTAQATTTVDITSVPTTGAAGFLTYTLKATSDAGNIIGFNFFDAADPSFGILGLLSQRAPFGANTVFDNVAEAQYSAAGDDISQDTHFLIDPADGIPVNASEDGTKLIGAFNFDAANSATAGPMLTFAQVVLPEDETGTYKGFFTVATSSAGNILEQVSGTIGGTTIPEPSTYVLAGMGLIGIVALRRRRVC